MAGARDSDRIPVDRHDRVTAPSVIPFETRLLSGTPILIRPLMPDDRPLVEAGITELSSETKYQRFNSPVFHPTEAQLDYLTRVDQRDHLALCAVDRSGADDVGAGIARCVRLPGRPEHAELAITVADRYQRQGLGLILLASLSRMASVRGVTTFVGYVDAERRGLLHILRALEGQVRRCEGGTAEIHMRVLDNPRLFPDTAIGRLGRMTLIQAG